MDQMRSQFIQPPKAYSPCPIWWWSGDELKLERLFWQMDRFVEGQVYNVVILNLAPTGPLYGSDPDQPRFMSEAWWSVMESVCQYASKIGLRIWFYDQIGFSGANLQGELVRENPHYAGLAIESVQVEGSGRLELACPSGGEPVSAVVFELDEDGLLCHDPMPVAIENHQAVCEVKKKSRLRLFYTIRRNFDYFSEEACQRLLQIVHGHMEKRLGRWFGEVIVGSFQDELPNLPTWGTQFAEVFQQRKGYSILDALTYLWEGTSKQAQRVRKDYQEVRASLAEQAFFKPFFQWHEKFGLHCGFDQQGPARAGDPKATVTSYADYLQTHQWYGIPGSDHHGEGKIHSSLAHVHGRERVWIEAFHSTGWGGTLEETFDWLLPWFRAGANLYNPHASYYSTRSGWYEWAPPSTCWRQPYWRHYPKFAESISRICYLLTRGRHVCDTAILFPTTTVQANLTFAGPLAPAERAQSVYKQLVGDMHWGEEKLGLMDQSIRDYDILSDEVLAMATVQNGSLCIRDEQYQTMVLPACRLLNKESARKLIEFVNDGGRLVAIEAVPQLAGDSAEDDLLAAELLQLFERGKAALLNTADEIGDVLSNEKRAVTAPVPTLHRRYKEYDLLFIPAAFPSATVHKEGSRWIQAQYSFDPHRYDQKMELEIAGAIHELEAWDLWTGQMEPISFTVNHEGNSVLTIPFRNGPAAMLVWRRGEQPAEKSMFAAGAEAVQKSAGPDKPTSNVIANLSGSWDSELLPTLDNRFADFDKPAFHGAPPIATWFFEHCREQVDAESPVSEASQSPPADADWSQVQATFGVRARWLGPKREAELPLPAANAAEAMKSISKVDWKPVIYSDSRGIPRDPIHVWTLGPKGHVPSEFLAFGEVSSGEGVQVQTGVYAPDEGSFHLGIGASAVKRFWINGVEVQGTGEGYLSFYEVHLRQGLNLMELRLIAETAMPLRAYWAFTRAPEQLQVPEWLAVPEPYRKDDVVHFKKELALPFAPMSGTIQLAADATAHIYVNGELVGRQGGFDPYNSKRRVIPYTTSAFKEGINHIEIQMQDIGKAAGILVDAVILSEDQRQFHFFSDKQWTVESSGDRSEQPVQLWRDWKINQLAILEPAYFYLWRRPHPLPKAEWLEERPSQQQAVELLQLDADLGKPALDWFRWTLPPGATTAEIPLSGKGTLWVDGSPVPILEGSANLPNPQQVRRTALLRVEPLQGMAGGSCLQGPIVYRMEQGRMELTDWAEQGLESYSGGVKYMRTLEIEARPSERIFLDLGEVRGTAEVRINQQLAGVRILTPFRFELTPYIVDGNNQLEIIVMNTLGPYLNAVSPTHYVFEGQTKSGLLGPVQLISESDLAT